MSAKRTAHRRVIRALRKEKESEEQLLASDERIQKLASIIRMLWNQHSDEYAARSVTNKRTWETHALPHDVATALEKCGFTVEFFEGRYGRRKRHSLMAVGVKSDRSRPEQAAGKSGDT